MSGHWNYVKSFFSFVTLFTIVLWLSLGAQPVAAQDREVLLDRSYQKILNYDYEGSIVILNKLLNEDSSYFKASYLRGMAYFYEGKNTEAMNDFQRVLKQEENYQHVYYFIGMIYASTSDYNHAIFSMSKEIKAHPETADSYYQRGSFYLKAFTYDTLMQKNALGDLQKAVSLDSTKSYYYYQLGLCQKYANKRREAIMTFNQAIKINPYAYSYYEERNTCHELVSSSLIIRKTDLYQGVKNLKKYKDPEMPGVQYYFVGKCFKLMYDFSKKKSELDSAMYYMNKSLSLDSSNADVYLEKGRIYRSCYRSESKACQEFKKGITISPKYTEMWLNYAWSLENQGKKKEAHEAFKEAFDLNPVDFRAKDGMSRTR